MWNEEYHYVGAVCQDKPFYINIAGITYPDPKYRIHRECSQIVTIEYIISGTGTVETADRVYHPKQGEVYILGCGIDQTYYCDPEDPWTKIWINVAGSVVDALLACYRLEKRVVLDGTGTRGYFERIIELCREKLPPDEIDRRAELIFHELLQQLWQRSREASIGISPEARRLRDYIGAHIQDKITVDELAGLIYKSKSQTMRIFSREFGTTPYEYLLNERMLQAKALLSGTNVPIKEIAYRSGFTDEHYFSYTFKKRCASSPSEFRERSRG